MTTKHTTTHSPRSFGAKILTLFTGFAVLLREKLLINLQNIQLIRNSLKKLLRCTFFVLVVIPVLTLTNFIVVNPVLASPDHQISGSWTTFQAYNNTLAAFTSNKRVNEITLGYESSYTFRDGNDTNEYIRLHIRASADTSGYRIKTLVNGVHAHTSVGTVQDRTTPYGTTTHPVTTGNRCSGLNVRCWEIRFNPDESALNGLARDKTVTIQFEMQLDQGGHSHYYTPELIIKRTNSGAEWSSGSTGSHTAQPTITDFSEQFGKITTYATGSNLQFKSQLFDNNTTAVETPLTKQELIDDWDGLEWTKNTTYGRWIVGNETDCSSEAGNSAGAKCYDVKFEPNNTTLNAVSNKNIKINLLSNELFNSAVVDTQTLSYTFTSKTETEISLGSGVSNTEAIVVVGGETSFPTTSRTARIYQDSAHDLIVEATEKRNTHTGSPTIEPGNKSTVSNSIGFDSKTYGTNFTYGKWYFEEESSQNTVGDPVNTDFENTTRRIRFVPDTNAIKAIGPNNEHKSELKITIKDGATVIATEIITIELSRPSGQILTIAAVNSTVDEGSSNAIFEITSTQQTGQPFSLYYTVTDPGGYVHPTNSPATIMFQNSYTDRFTLPLRTSNNEDEDDNTVQIEIILNPSNSGAYARGATRTATITVKDIDVPRISIRNAPDTPSTLPAKFEIRSNIEPKEPLEIRYRPKNIANQQGTVANYLDAGLHNSIQVADPGITFESKTEGVNTIYFASISIPTIEDTNNTTGTISVDLLDDTATEKTYRISTNTADNTKTAQIFDIPVPELSIKGSDQTINEGDSTTIEVTATVDPRRELTFNYTPTATGSNFLKIRDGKTSGQPRTAKLTFTEDTTANPRVWTANIPIETIDADGLDSAHSTITVVLDAPGANDKYTVTSVANEDRLAITVHDDTKPVIKITGDAPTLDQRVSGIRYAEFPITTTITQTNTPAPMMVKYMGRATQNNFLDENLTSLERTTEITFTGSSPNFTATLNVPVFDDRDATSGTFEVVLLANPTDYTLPNLDAEKKGSVTVHDISYIDFNPKKDWHRGVAIDPIDGEIAYVYIRNSTTNYPRIEGKIRVLAVDDQDLFFQVDTFLDDVLIDSTEKRMNPKDENGNHTFHTFVTPYGYYNQTQYWGNSGGHARNDWRFDPNDNAVNNLPPGSKVRVEINYEVSTNVRKTLKINFLHNASVSWDSNSKETFAEVPNSANVGDPKTATIESYYSDLTDFTFKSRITDGAATPTEAPLNLDAQASVTGWTGDIYTHDTNTTYGKWLLEDRQQTCETIAKCYNVRFEPNASAINAATDRTVKVELVITNTVHNEIDTLSFIINESNLTLSANTGHTNQINATTSTTTLANIPGTASLNKLSSDSLIIEVNETTNNAGALSANGMVRQSIDNAEGFRSKEYGTNLNLGTWYFEESSLSPPANPIFRAEMRQFLFKPNLTNIKLIPASESRQSTLTVKINDGTNDIVTKKFTVTIHNVTKPVFSIEAVTSSINEGGTMQFKVTSDINPGTSTYEDVTYTPVNTEGDYLASTLDNVSQEVDLTFTSETVNGEEVWTETFDVALRAIDTTSTSPGKVTITLDPITITNPADVIYLVATTPDNAAEVTVNDATPITITIADAPDTYATKPAQFVLTASTQPYRPIVVKYTPGNVTGMALNQSQCGSLAICDSDPITFGPSADDPTVSVGILSIPTIKSLNTQTSMINVFLRDNSDDTIYTTTGTRQANTKVATISNITIPEISIRTAETSVDEGGDATITITSNVPLAADRDVVIKFTPTNEVGNYLQSDSADEDSGETRTETLRFTTTNNVHTATFDLETRDADAFDAAHGRISLVLNPPGPTDLYTLRASPDDRINITVYDSIRPDLTLDTNASDVIGGVNAEFTIKSDRQPFAPLDIKYTATESGTNFLAPNGYNPSDTRTGTVTFSGTSPNFTGTLSIPTQIDPSAPSGTITIELQTDDKNYTIQTATNEKSAQVVVRDPSFIKVLLSTPANPTVYDQSSRVIAITDLQATYPNMTAQTSALYADRDNLEAVASITVDGTTTSSNTLRARHGNVQTNYGRWVLNDDWTELTDGSGHATATARFEPNSTVINNIAAGTIVTIALNLTVPTNVTSTTTITIAHNTSVLWSDGEDTVREIPGTTESNTRNEATITTFHTPVSELTFKSKLFDDSSIPSEVPLEKAEKVTEWNGQEWYADTTYGEWVIRAPVTCQTSANCYDVRFLPKTTAIDAISGKVVKLDLEVSIPASGQTEPFELDSLTYILDGNTVSIALDPGSLNDIFVGGSTAALDDVTAIATIARNTGYDVIPEVVETQNNAGTDLRTGNKGDMPNDHAGFDSYQYGTNLNYGSWYFAEDNISAPDVSVVDSGFHTITRKVLFRPTVSALTNLTAGSTRKSTLTLAVKDGSETISTTTITITMRRVDKPVYTLTAASTSINEGEQLARLTIAVDRDPAGSTVNLQYTPTQSAGAYLNVSPGASGLPRPVGTIATWTPTPGKDEWTAPLNVSLNARDNANNGDGTISIALVNPGTSATYIANTTPVVLTILDQDIPELSIVAPSVTWTANRRASGSSNLYPRQVYKQNNLNFTVNSTVAPKGGSIQMKFIPTNVTGGFLNPSGGESGDQRTHTLRFNTSTSATLPVAFLNDPSVDEGQVKVQLVSESGNARIFTLKSDGDDATATLRRMYIEATYSGKDSTTINITNNGTYGNVNARVRHRTNGGTGWGFRVRVFENNSRIYASSLTGFFFGASPTGAVNQDTKYGRFIMKALTGTQGQFKVRNDGVTFQPNSTAINRIPLGTIVRAEVHVWLTNYGLEPSGTDLHNYGKVRHVSTIYIRHESSSDWAGGARTSLTESKNSADIGNDKNGTITTFHDDTSEISFKVNLTEESATPTEPTFTREEHVGEWPEMEWTAQTTYGRWLVGNERECQTDGTCYDVRFKPNTTNISNLDNRRIKYELEMIVTESGQAGRTSASLSYQITGDSLALTLNSGQTTVIKASDGVTSYDDIGATATAFKLKTDSFRITTKETKSNDETDTGPGNEINQGITTPFQSKTYGNDLTYGSWYFELTGHTATAYQPDSLFHTAIPRLLFRPKADAINNLNIGDVRYSTITITTRRGNTDITSQTLTVAIFRTNKPTFSIEAVGSTADEGGAAMFRVESDINPGNTLYTLLYKAFNTTGAFLKASDGVHGATRQEGLRFEETPPGSGTWTKTFSVNMKDLDTVDEAHGSVTVTLNPVTLTTPGGTYTTALAPANSATVTVYDQTIPEITIANAPEIASAEIAQFPLTSDILPLGSSLGIRFIPSNVSPGEYLNETDTTYSNAGVSGAVRVAAPRVQFTLADDGTNYVGTLSVPSKGHPATDGGSISVELLDGSPVPVNGPKEYKIDTAATNTRTVTIADYPKVTISIKDRTDTITEGNSAEIVFVATENPVRTLEIKYTPTESGTTYLTNDDDGNGTGVTRTTDPLRFELDPQLGKYIAKTTIATTGNDADGPHGTITVALVATGADDVYDAATTDNSMTITVNDDEKPTITIGDVTNVDVLKKLDSGLTAEFPITASFQPHGNSLDIKYTISENTGGFLSSTITNPTEEKSEPIAFTNSAGTLSIATNEEGTTNTGTISITLQVDNLNYTLSSTISERTKSVTVKDNSYLSVKFNAHSQLSIITYPRDQIVANPDLDLIHEEVATLFVKDTTTDYTDFGTTLRIRGKDIDDARFQAQWYINNTFEDETDQLGKNNTFSTPYGDWVIDNSLGNSNSEHTSNGNSKFVPNDTAINNLDPGQKVRIVLNKEVPTNVTRTTILHIVHNTSPSWNGTASAALTERQSTGDFSTNKEATITTYHNTLSEISFKSKLYDGSANPTQDLPLAREELVSSWSGMEWTATNNYGRWIVGTRSSCEDNTNCFNVRFEPNETNIDEIADKAVRLVLETIITESGSPTETKALTYNIVDDSLTIAEDTGHSSEIVARTVALTYSDINGTATAFKGTGDTFDFEVAETSPDDPQLTNDGNESGTVDNTTFAFRTKQYGSDLTYGSWYLAVDNTDVTPDPANSDYHTASRKFVFKPNSDNINALQSGELRTSTLTVKTIRGTDTINTATFTITIRKSTKPNFTISAVTATIDEGGTAMFEVESDLDPGPNEIVLNYKPFNTTGEYLAAGLHNVTQQARLTLTNPPGGDDVWTDRFSVAMRTDNLHRDQDTEPGTVTVTLEPVASDAAFTIATAPGNSAAVTVNDLTTPVITIADAPRTIAGRNAEFTLTADPQPWQPLGIRYIPTETGTSFLDPSRGDPGDMITIDPKITFGPSSDGQSVVGTLSIPTRVDPDGNTSGTISIQLLDDAKATLKDYTITGNQASNTKTVSVVEKPTISFTSSTDTVSEGNVATIVLESNIEPFGPVDIVYVPTETTSTSYLVDRNNKGSGEERSDRLNFTRDDITGKWTEEITINTLNIDADSAHGTIKIVLTQPAANADFQVGANLADRTMTLTVQDTNNPLITISDAERVFRYDTAGKFEAKFPLASTFVPYNNGEIDIKFLVSESGPAGVATNFLDSTQYTTNQAKTEPVTFDTDDNGNHTGMLTIHLVDDPNNFSGTITVTLQEDSINYDLSDQDAQKTATGAVQDPSYARVALDSNSRVPVTESEQLRLNTGTLLVYDTNENYSNITAKFRRLVADQNNVTFRAEWYANDSQTPEATPVEETNASSATLTTKYGRWVISGGGSTLGTGKGQYRLSNAHFEPNDAVINAIPLGDSAIVRLLLTVPNQVTYETRLIIVHTDSSSWLSSRTDTLRESRGTADFTTNKIALIKSPHTTLNEISFRAQTYEGTTDPDVDTSNPTPTDLAKDTSISIPGWTGDIWTATTKYGRWVVGDNETCFGTENCFAVFFNPDPATIGDLSNKIVRADLEIIVTENGTPTMGDTISYIIDGRDVSVALTGQSSQQISATKNTTSLDDVASIATIFKKESDTIDFAVEETTTNQDAQVDEGSEGPTTDLTGFLAKPYGADLKMGTWYVAEANTGTPRNDSQDSTFQTFSRQILFKPDLDEIKELDDGDTRKSRLTISILNGTDAVATTEFEVTIEKRRIPILEFTVANATVTATEGGELKFIVNANFNPGNNAIDVEYTLNETGTTYWRTDENAEESKTLKVPLTFRPDGIFFTAEIPVILNSPDTANTGPGTISIILGTPDSDALYEIDENNKSATATIVDTLLPKVSIEDASPTFNGTDIVFTLKSDIEVAKPFTIKVKPENSIGNFLDVSGSGRASGATRDIPNVRFPRTSSTQTTFSHELRIPTVIDSTLVEGEIDIELISRYFSNQTL